VLYVQATQKGSIWTRPKKGKQKQNRKKKYDRLHNGWKIGNQRFYMLYFSLLIK